MRSSMLLAVALASALAVPAAQAPDVSGKWRGKAESGTEIALALQLRDAEVTGTVALNRGRENAISEGRFENGRLSFSMPSMYGNGTVAVQGTLDEGQLVLALESGQGKTTARLKRE